MAPIEKEDVTAFATDLGTVSEDAWEKILAYVNQVNLTECDSDEDRVMARIYLAAHFAKSLPAAGSSTTAAGPVTSESVGAIRRSYAFVASSTGSALSKTNYGSMYLEIINASLAGGPLLV